MYIRIYNKHLIDWGMLLLWCVGSVYIQRQLLPSSADPAAFFEAGAAPLSRPRSATSPMEVYVYDPSPHFPRDLTGYLDKWLGKSKFKIPLLGENFYHTTSIQKVGRTQTRSQQSDVAAERPAPINDSIPPPRELEGPATPPSETEPYGGGITALTANVLWGHYRGAGRSSGGRLSRPLRSSQTSHWESLQSPEPSPGKALEQSDVLCNKHSVHNQRRQTCVQ